MLIHFVRLVLHSGLRLLALNTALTGFNFSTCHESSANCCAFGSRDARAQKQFLWPQKAGKNESI